MPQPIAALLLAVLVPCAAALPQAGDRKNDPQSDLPGTLEIPPAPPLTPEEELATFQLPEGFEIRLAAAEPLVVDPVQITFDELGRMWVVEMRGYMRDADGTGELDPIGVIAILSDDDGDGVMDRREVFADELVLPRGVLPMAGGALCILPPELVFLRDDDGDGTFDVREVVATGLKQALNNPEHAINTPTLGLDGWIHFANWNRRVRRVVDEEGEPRWEVRPVRGGGQWGLSMDEEGRALRNTNPNPLYVDLVPTRYAVRNRHQRSFRGAFAGVDAKNDTYPSRINPGVNRGYQPATLRDDFTLARFTGACAPTCLRGDGLGADARGDVFVAEPTGNLVKRYDMVEPEGAMGPTAKSVHGKFDFLTSTDERFRPVAMTTGPDGALWVADMYRGLIQHRIFLTTFLRRQAEARGLVGPMGLGRVWRVVRTDAPAPPPEVALLDAETIELVGYLSSDNAWLREQAQRLIVEFFDGEANVVAALRNAVRGTNAAGTKHALFALDGIGFLAQEDVRAALESRDPGVLCAALQLAGPRLDDEGADLFERVAELATTARGDRVRLYALLALGDSADPRTLGVYARRMTESAASSYERSAVVSGLEFREAEFLGRLRGTEAWAARGEGRTALLEELGACIGREGLAENVEWAIATVLDPPADWWSQPLLDGLYSTRRKGPKGERLPLPLRAMPASLMIRESGEEQDSVAASVDQGCTWPGKPGAVEPELPRELTAVEQEQFAMGAVVYGKACATCHQPHGGGQMGKAPTLRGTRFVVGDEERLVKILMHGLSGPLEIDGEVWNLEMPRFEGTDEELAAVLTYVRRSWGNGAEPVAVDTVTALRK